MAAQSASQVPVPEDDPWNRDDPWSQGTAAQASGLPAAASGVFSGSQGSHSFERASGSSPASGAASVPVMNGMGAPVLLR